MNTVKGKLGGQYLMVVSEDGEKYIVKAQYQDIPGGYSGTHTIFSGDYSTATKLIDYCAQHDGATQVAVKELFYQGDPTSLISLIETAKADPTARARRRVAVQCTVETDILESEDAITSVSQRAAAAFHWCGVTVRQLEVQYVGGLPQGVGIDFCLNAVEQALMIKGLAQEGMLVWEAYRLLRNELVGQPHSEQPHTGEAPSAQ